jgi:predicted enzyme related to lactoylglutathione lyase
MRGRRFLAAGVAALLGLSSSVRGSAQAASVAVGPQYDSTHVYVAPADLNAFVTSFTATFGGQVSKVAVMNVLPVQSSTEFQYVSTPVGGLSVFAFQTPVPFPFGDERTGYLVTDMDAAIKSVHAAGAAVIVEPFRDPVGRDAVIEWPGGLKMQLYWHFIAPKYAPLQTIPENRVYVSADVADALVKSFVQFAGGRVTADDAKADAGEIGRPGEAYRRVRIASLFGKMVVMVTDGHLPYPFGREITGYEVGDLAATLAKAKASGAKIVFGPYRGSAVVSFPGGYVAEIHSGAR